MFSEVFGNRATTTKQNRNCISSEDSAWPGGYQAQHRRGDNYNIHNQGPLAARLSDPAHLVLSLNISVKETSLGELIPEEASF